MSYLPPEGPMMSEPMTRRVVDFLQHLASNDLIWSKDEAKQDAQRLLWEIQMDQGVGR